MMQVTTSLEFSITEESVGSESIYGININLLSSIEVSLGQMILSIETSDSTRHRIVRKGSSVNILRTYFRVVGSK